MSAEMGCKFCGDPIHATNEPEFRLQVVEYPYSPEWPLTMRDAGVFCSRTCLIDYLNNTRPST